MTAPTPDLIHEARQYAADDIYPGAILIHDLADALAAVTAERDQAVRELAEQKRVNTSNLKVMTEQLDQAREALAATNKLGAFETGKTIGAAEVRKELDQARQMLADAEKKIASMELDESLREEDERFADPL